MTDGLRLELSLSKNSTGALEVSFDEFNTLDASNNVTAGDSWLLSARDLGYVCGTGEIPAGYEILQGYYGLSNYTYGNPLSLDEVDLLGSVPCPNIPQTTFYDFGPFSDQASVQTHNPDFPFAAGTITVNTTAASTGFWTGTGLVNSSTFHPFPDATYTVVGADEWGQLVILHFEVRPAA